MAFDIQSRVKEVCTLLQPDQLFTSLFPLIRHIQLHVPAVREAVLSLMAPSASFFFFFPFLFVVVLSYFSEVPPRDEEIKLQDVGFPPQEIIIPLPACPVICVVKGAWVQRKEKACAEAQASSHAAGKITKTLAGGWL